MKILGAFIVAWVLLSVSMYTGASAIFDSSGLKFFEEHGETVYGNVASKEEQNHQLIHYTYEVDGTKYSGEGRAGAGNPTFNELDIGESVVVFYDPTVPSMSILGYPQYDIELNRQMIWVVTILGPIIALAPLIIFYFVFQAIRRSTG